MSDKVEENSKNKVLVSESKDKRSNKPINKKLNTTRKLSVINNNKDSKNAKTLVKPVEVETRASLQQKLKILEEELEKYESERTRILQELDRLCEDRDNSIRELKTMLHEKQVEINHHMSSFINQKISFDEEINQLRMEIDNNNTDFKNKEKELIDRNESLLAKLNDLNDYILNKEHTMAKIRELEEIIKQERNFHQRIKDKLKSELKTEKHRVEEEVTSRVKELTNNLEKVCVQKLSIDAKVALEKFVELSNNYEACESENRELRQQNKNLKLNNYNQRIRIEISESLLTEMLKQISRKLYRRKEIAIQCTIGENRIANKLF